jgi:hypothetical protein
MHPDGLAAASRSTVLDKSDREEFLSNQEQVSRPDDQTNGEKATKQAGSNSDPSI